MLAALQLRRHAVLRLLAPRRVDSARGLAPSGPGTATRATQPDVLVKRNISLPLNKAMLEINLLSMLWINTTCNVSTFLKNIYF